MPGQFSYLIIGNGIAGVTAAEILRNEDSAADITVVADDPFPVYYRPALKDYLAGRVREDKLWARPNSFYQDHRIRFLSDRALGILVGQHTLQLQSGSQVGYDRLLLANGARACRLSCPGIGLEGVTTLRTVADYQAVVSRLHTARRIVVSGSGTLALETIETLRHRGYRVTHLLRRRTLWSDVLDATASDLVLQQERRDGVDVRLEEEIAEVMGQNGQVSGVITTRGARISCDMVILAVGVEPILDFITSSGIPCGRGVKVDAALRTSAPDIYACGDVLETTDELTGRTRILGQWYPAIQQARAAAYSMLGVLDTGHPFRSTTFYNATFLYGLDFASVGLTHIQADGRGYQEVTADPLPRTYRKVLLKDGVLVGMLALGDRRGTLALKRALDHSVNLSPVASRLFDGNFTLDDWLDREGVPPPVLGPSREGAIAVRQAAYTGGTTVAASIELPQLHMEALLVRVVNMPQAQQQDVPLPRPAEEETRLSQTKVMTVGRQAGTYLLIDQDSVSRRHAEITYVNSNYLLRDLGSANGTFVNEERLAPGRAAILKPDDRVLFGKAQFVFRIRGAGGSRGLQMPSRSHASSGLTHVHHMATGIFDTLAGVRGASPPTGQPLLTADGSLLLPGAAQALPADIVATLEQSPALIVITAGAPQVIHLKQGRRVTIGRDTACDIVLAEVAASRKHAEVFPGPDGFYIRDLKSANGVLVNQLKIDNPYLLVHGDRILIGGIALFFLHVRQAYGEGAEHAAWQGWPGQVMDVPQPHAEHKGQVKTCRNCGAANIRIARFCVACGLSLESLSAHIKQ
jgi:NADPH-dependent 2,4-dienoyl-CoA reductase/sulfur reductase-like enzyme/pSer/pThr/pTyr-binding forkhead associated (FHA) protein